VDRFTDQKYQLREFDECKDQMIKVFEKAGDKGVRITIPTDYAVAKKPSKSINLQNQQLSGRGSK